MADFITIIPQSTFNDTQRLLKDINAIADAVERVNKEAAKIKFPSEARGVIEKTNEEIGKTNKLLSDTEVIRRRQQTAIRNLTVARSAENKTIQQQRVEALQLNRRQKEESILTSNLVGAYQKLNLRRSQASQRLRDLIVSETASNREIRRAQREFDKLDRRIRKANGAVKSGTLDVGRYKIALGSARVTAIRFASALGFTGVIFGLVRGFSEAIRVIREFDAQLIAVGKTTGLQGAELDELAQKTIDLGLQLKGISIAGLLQTAEVAGQLGIKGTENILQFSEAVEKLRITSNVTSEETIRDFAKFIEVSSDSAENADRLGSVITRLGNNFATTETQIISNATEIQKGIALFDTSAQSVLGLGAATNALGAEAEASRTAIQKTFNVINKSISTGKGLNDILTLTGLTEKELAKQFREDATGVFVRFVEGLSKINESGGDVTAVLEKLQLSNVRVNAVVGALAKNFGVLEDAVNQANKEYVDNVAANEEVEAATKSLNSIIGDLKDSWDAFILSIDKGDGVISNFIRTSAQGLTDFVNGLIKINTTATEEGVKSANAIVEAFKTNNETTAQETINFIQSQISAAGNNIAALQTRLSQRRPNFFSTSTQVRRFKETEQALKKEMAIREELQQILIKEQETKAKLNEETDKEIEKEKEIDTTKKKGIAIVAGSIAAIEKQIKQLEELRDKTALTEAQFKKFNDQISALEGLILRITGISGLETDGLIPIEPEQVNLIKDAQAAMNEYLGRVDDAEAATRKLKNATDDFLKTFTTGFFQDAGLQSLEQFFDGTFDLLFAGAKELGKEFETTFVAIAEVAQEAFSFIEQAQAASIQKQLDDLNTQKEIALMLNEGNAEAIAAINEQAAAQEAEIRRKQAEQNKQNALFNIAINTAQGVVAALASVPPNIPLSITIGAIGALQAALVASQPIPQFAQGVRDFEGGLAVVGDGGVPEVVSSPGKGHFVTPAKPTLMNLPAGTDVFKNVRDFDLSLNKMLLSNRIEPLRRLKSNNITAGEMDAIFARNMRKMTALNLNIDQGGFSLSVQKGLAKTNIHKNRTQFKGQKV